MKGRVIMRQGGGTSRELAVAGLDFLSIVVAAAIWLGGRDWRGRGSGRAALGTSREKSKDCHLAII